MNLYHSTWKSLLDPGKHVVGKVSNGNVRQPVVVVKHGRSSRGSPACFICPSTPNPKGMKPEKILFPIDVRRCPLDVFPLVNGVASRPDVTVTLLHVVTLNILPLERRIYDELVAEAYWFLERLVTEYLPAATSAQTRVRVGNATEEVLAEAKEGSADLMILPSYGPSFWRRLTSLWKQPLRPAVSSQVARITRAANCRLFIVSSDGSFDCESEWGRPSKESLAALNGAMEREQDASAAKPACAAYAQRSDRRRFRFEYS
jgi:nucleotide-binding universal stress UspA family protein